MAGHDITPASAWVPTIHVPNSGDPVLASDLAIAATALSAREQFLKNGVTPPGSTTHTCPLISAPIAPNSWSQGLGDSWYDSPVYGAPVGPLRINLLLPDGATIDSISVYYTGSTGSPHASDLSNITKCVIYGYVSRYDGVLIGPIFTVTDPSTSDSAYGVNHAITIINPVYDVGAPLIPSNSQFAYLILVVPEAGAGRKEGGKVTGVRFTYHFPADAGPSPSFG